MAGDDSLTMQGSDRPIFVVGFQRSGTTLLQSLLGSHPHIAAPPEMYFLFRIAGLASHYGDLNDDENLRRAVHDALHPPVDLLTAAEFDDDAVFERARGNPRTMRGLFDALMQDFTQRHGKVRWSEKSPGQTVRAIRAFVPEAQIVQIVRDPRDVIVSSLKTPWTDESAYSLASRWRSFTQRNVRVGLALGPASFLQIRYEDLTRDPVSTLTLIFSFLGEAFDPDVIMQPERRRASISVGGEPWQRRVLDEITPAVEGGWKRQLPRTSRLIVGAVLAPWLEALGYEPTPTSRRVVGNILSAPPAISARLARLRQRTQIRDERSAQTAIRSYLEEQARAMSARGN